MNLLTTVIQICQCPCPYSTLGESPTSWASRGHGISPLKGRKYPRVLVARGTSIPFSFNTRIHVRKWCETGSSSLQEFTRSTKAPRFTNQIGMSTQFYGYRSQVSHPIPNIVSRGRGDHKLPICVMIYIVMKKTISGPVKCSSYPRAGSPVAMRHV